MQEIFAASGKVLTWKYALRDASFAVLAASACLAGLLSAQAFAQEAPAADAAADAGELVVTGTRIQRSGFESPAPITAITAEDLELKADRSAIAMFADMPSVRPNRSVTGSTNVGGAQIDLRGLGSARTLILIDGRRVASTTPSGGVDINILPSALIERVDIVTGGASAAYGSDAVSGVVNIFLNDDFEGLRGDIQWGETGYHDNQERGASLGWGSAFAGGRGNIVAAGEIYRNGGASMQASRPWGQDAWALIANPAYAPGNGQPRQFILPNTRLSLVSDGGVITSAGPLQYIQFGENGAQSPFDLGTNVGTGFMTGGDGTDLSPAANLAPQIERESLFARVTYDFTPNITGFADVLYARSSQEYDVIPNYNSGDLVISQDNAFLPDNIRQTMIDNNLQTIRMGRANLELGFNQAYGENTTQRFATGLQGEIGERWTWDTFVQYSKNRYYSTVGNNRHQARWLQSVDSVIDPDTGNPVCRSTLTNPNDGCVPANVFGVDSITPDVVAFTTGTSVADAEQTQTNVAFNIQGEPFSIWAGPVSFATGVEYRDESIDGTSDPISQATGWRAANPQPLNGQFDVTEGYVETVVPLARDLPGIDSLEFNGAARYAHYSTSGGVTTWKVGLTYSPIEEVRFRATRSRDIRAPNINELFAARNQNINAVTDRETNLTVQALQLTGGNPDLDPETADTFTGGVVYQPSWADGLRLSVDYYNIEMEGAIGTLSAQTIVDRCFAGETSLCSAITRNPTTNQIVSVFASYFNSQQLQTSGVDIEAVYSFPLDQAFGASTPGDLSLHLVGTYIDELATTNSNITTDTAGQLTGGGVPHWRVNLTTTYTNGPFTLSGLIRYIEGGVYNSTWVEGVDINNNDIPGRTYLNLSGRYDLNDHWQLFGVINNVFDEEPPVAPNSLFEPYTSTSPYFDLLGRAYSIGVRFQY